MCSIITTAPEGCFCERKKKSLGHKEKKQLLSPAAFFLQFFSPPAFIAAAAELRPSDALAASRHFVHDDCCQLLQLLADGQFALLVKSFYSAFCLCFFLCLFAFSASNQLTGIASCLPKNKKQNFKWTFTAFGSRVVGGREVTPFYSQLPPLASFWWTH